MLDMMRYLLIKNAVSNILLNQKIDIDSCQSLERMVQFITFNHDILQILFKPASLDITQTGHDPATRKNTASHPSNRTRYKFVILHTVAVPIGSIELIDNLPILTRKSFVPPRNNRNSKIIQTFNPLGQK